MKIRVELWGPEAAKDAEALHGVYRAAFGEPPYRESVAAAAHWRDETLPKHAGRQDFRCAVALVGDELVGFAYGYTGHHGQWWTDRIASILPREEAAYWLGGHFEFVELAVAPAYQRHGVGAALHDTLLSDLPNPRALLTTWSYDTPARRLYLRRGWRVLIQELSYEWESSLFGLDLTARPA